MGVSLGSFTVSKDFLEKLLTAFAAELAAKEGKLDTDPHWWMPLTLDLETYKTLIMKKDHFKDAAEAEAHYNRMQEFKKTFPDQKKLFGAVGIGPSTEDAGIPQPYWWDYGQLKWFQKNTLLTVGCR